MPTALKPGDNKEDEQLSHAHNPAQDEFEQIINANYGKYTPNGDNIAQRDTVLERQREREEMFGRQTPREDALDGIKKSERPASVGGGNKSVDQQEAQPWETDLGSEQGEKQQNSSSNLNPLDKYKKFGLIGGGLVSLVVAAITLFFSLLTMLVVDFKENNYEASTKRAQVRTAQRAAKNMDKKYFRAPEDCKGIRCTWKRGVSDREIRKLERGGHTVGIGETTIKGKKYKYVKSIRLFASGELLTKDNFAQQFQTSPRVRAFTAKTLSISGSFPRTTSMVIKMNRGLDMSRQNQLADAEKQNKESFKKKLRQYLFGDYKGKFDIQAKEQTNDTGEVINEDQVAGDDELNEEIQEAAEEERERLLEDPNARPSLIPDLSKVAQAAAGGSVEGALKYSRLSSYAEAGCDGYRILRAVDYGAKFYRMIALVRYAGLLMTFADAIKAGEVTMEQLNFIAYMLLLPDAQGRNFFDSPGFQYLIYKLQPSRSSVANYTNGTTTAGVIGDVRRSIDKATGNNADEFCRVVDNVLFQIGSTIVSAVAAFFSGGTSLGLSMATGAAGGVLLAVLETYAVPILITYAAGTVVTGDENGFELGTTAAAGMTSFSGHLSRSQGLRVLSKSELAADTRETNNLYNDFFPENKPSLTDKISTNVAAFGMRLMSTTAIFKPQTLLAHVGTNYSSSNVYATDSVAPSDVCDDEDYKEAGWATDAFCNPIYGESSRTLNDPRYDPEAVVDYMIDNEYVDEETGDPRDTDNGEEYTKYRDICMDGTVAMVNFDVDVNGETINPMKYCDQDGDAGQEGEKYRFMRYYRWDQNINEDPSKVRELLSQDYQDNSGSSGGGKLSAWPVGGGGGTISSCWNINDQSYRQHHGLDIAAPVGTDIIAPADGVVTFAGPSGGYGLYIAIKHADVATGYGHNDQNLVEGGDTVRQGQVIGKVGNRGQSTGPHLHFNVMPPDRQFTSMSTSTSYNPLKYLTKPSGVADPQGCVAKAGN